MAIQTLPIDRPRAISLPSTAGISHRDDRALLDDMAEIVAVQRQVEGTLAVFAAELARRSDRSLGQSGLAAREGFARVGDLLQAVTGVSKSASGSLVAAGELLAGAKPWLGSVARAMESGELSIATGAAIAAGLGTPGADVSADALADAAVELVESAAGVAPEQSGADARRRRAELDVASVADLDEHRFAKRSFLSGTNPDGTVWGRYVADPENGAVIMDALRTITASRRPEFRDADEVAAEREHDPRTPDQRDFDAFVSIIKLGISSKDQHLFGHNDATVRVHVSVESLTTGDGVAWIEGVDDLQPATTAQRIACTAGIIPIILDRTGNVLNVGRAQRLFTPAQRIALAARDGGCVIPGCRVPARFCESHHTTPWREGGKTDLADGVLLCRFHHHMVHAQQWRIMRDADSTYWLEPPPGSRAPRKRLTSKTPPLRT